MKYLFFLISICIVHFSCQGKIIEAEKFKEIIPYTQPDTLVILDIDDTLLIPIQSLGTDVWFISRLKHYHEIENDHSLVLDKALAEWEAVRHLTKVKIVEEGTDEIINKMQNNHVMIMGLTTQGLALATRTVVQLNSLNIDLSKTAPSDRDHYFMNGQRGVLYRQGILFTAGSPKGEALMKFLDAIKYYPKSIVFINDKKTHLQDVEKSVISNHIDFVGLRYSYSDQRVNDYSQKIADLQWKCSTFDHIISDEEAALLLNSIEK